MRQLRKTVLCLLIAAVALASPNTIGEILRLGRLAFVGFPAASALNEGGLLYDSTVQVPRYSDGVTWIPLAGMGSSASIVVFQATSGEAIDTAELVSMDDSVGLPRLFKADSNGTTPRKNIVGVAATTVAGAGFLVTVVVSGEVSVADAQWDIVPVVADVGQKVFLSETAGNWTLTAPSTSGDIVIRTGIVSQGGAGAVKVVFQVGEGTIF